MCAFAAMDAFADGAGAGRRQNRARHSCIGTVVRLDLALAIRTSGERPDPPPPYAVAPAFPKLKFEFPVVLRPPVQGTSRLFVGELKGPHPLVPERPGLQEGRPGTRSRQAVLRPIGRFTVWSSIHNLTTTPLCYTCVLCPTRTMYPTASVVSRFTVSRTDPP